MFPVSPLTVFINKMAERPKIIFKMEQKLVARALKYTNTLLTAHHILRFEWDCRRCSTLEPRGTCLESRSLPLEELQYVVSYHDASYRSNYSQEFWDYWPFLAYKHEFTHVHASTPREQQLQGSEVAPYARANLIAFLFQVHGSPLKSVRLKGLMNNASHWSPRSLPYCHAFCLTLVNNPKSALHSLHTLHNCALKGLGFRWLLPTEWVLECSVLRANVEVCSSDFLL